MRANPHTRAPKSTLWHAQMALPHPHSARVPPTVGSIFEKYKAVERQMKTMTGRSFPQRSYLFARSEPSDLHNNLHNIHNNSHNKNLPRSAFKFLAIRHIHQKLPFEPPNKNFKDQVPSSAPHVRERAQMFFSFEGRVLDWPA